MVHVVHRGSNVKVHHFKERLEAAQQKLQLGHEELQVRS